MSHRYSPRPPALRIPNRRLAIAFTVAAAALCGRAPAGAQQIFHTGVNLVLVDVRVLRGDEQVTDLRVDEVTLLVDGDPRPIVSFAYYPSGRQRAEMELQPPGGNGREAARISAAMASGPRRVVLVVDSQSIKAGEGPRLLKAARQFIDRLPSGHAIAVASLPLEGGIRFDPDRDASVRALAEALKRTSRRGSGLEGIAGFGCTGAAASEGCGDQGLPISGAGLARAREMNISGDLRIRGHAVLHDLQWVFRAVGDGPSDVVLITGGLPLEETLRVEIDRTIKAARITGVRVHALEMAGLTEVPLTQGGPLRGGDRSPLSNAYPATYGLPAETGGIEEARSVSGGRFFERLGRELAGSYLLSFEPLPPERDGTPHRIEIRTSRRPQPDIHARKLFVIEPESPGAAAARVAAGSPTLSSAGRAAASPPAPAGPGSPMGSSSGPTAAASSAGIAGDAPALRTLIERASAYVDTFQRTLATVVTEERYVQVVKLWTGAPPVAGDEPALAPTPRKGEPLAKRGAGPLRRRELVSDLLLVRAPGEEIWIGYRDVSEVDGKAVRDRGLRVQKLFLSARAADRRQLRRIAEESARHNLGTGRTLNLPTFPLQVLHSSSLGRFLWTQHPDDSQGSTCCAVVDFAEVTSPTMVRTPAGRDVPMTGRLWIEPRTGRVTRAVLQFANQAEQVEGAFDVTYAAREGFDVLIPDRLWEWYRTPDPEHRGRRAYVEGEATYGEIRRFTVSTHETIK